MGEHTPLVAAGSGIRQHDLAVVKGKQYVGYIWLKARRRLRDGHGHADVARRRDGQFKCD